MNAPLKAVLAGAFALLLPMGLEAKTLYVNAASGNDSVSYAANGPDSPWRTIGRAAWGSTSRTAMNGNEAARAGDVVMIAPGTYSSTWSARNGLTDIYYNPANSGTSSAPIRFQSTTGARGAIVLTNSGRGALIGASERSYIVWSDFRIEDPSALADLNNTGKVIFFGATGGGIENSIIRGSAADESLQQGDNWSGVRLNESTGQRIANNLITDFGPSMGDENNSGITTYQSVNLTIENNQFERNGAGIYLKGNYVDAPVSGWYRIRFNVFRGNTEGMRILLIPSTASAPNVVHQNLFLQNATGIRLTTNEDGPSAPRHAKIVNNTFVNNTRSGFAYDGVHHDGVSHMFWNNIVVGGPYSLTQNPYGQGPQLASSKIDFEHNLYSGGTLANVSSSTYSLSTWRSAFGQDSAAPASVSADPQFVNAGAGDYRLSASSPAASLGRAVYGVGGADGATIRAGAYITGNEVIGLGTSAGGGTTTPGAPRNLRITTP